MRIESVFSAFALAVLGCAPVAPVASVVPRDEGSKLLVTTTPTCPSHHTCDILEVVDIHTDAQSQDKGFDELRAHARALGANAVVGAEFEHGDNGEPSHLSGMVVRYGKPIPPHVDLGEVDIPSDPTAPDKGLSQLAARAKEMGGDNVIQVTFEHGDDGAQGHLRGRVIRYE